MFASKAQVSPDVAITSHMLLLLMLLLPGSCGICEPTSPSPGASLSDLSEADRFYLSDEYKAEVVSAMSTSQLIEICLINPTVTLTPSYRWGLPVSGPPCTCLTNSLATTASGVVETAEEDTQHIELCSLPGGLEMVHWGVGDADMRLSVGVTMVEPGC